MYIPHKLLDFLHVGAPWLKAVTYLGRVVPIYLRYIHTKYISQCNSRYSIKKSFNAIVIVMPEIVFFPAIVKIRLSTQDNEDISGNLGR